MVAKSYVIQTTENNMSFPWNKQLNYHVYPQFHRYEDTFVDPAELVFLLVFRWKTHTSFHILCNM